MSRCGRSLDRPDHTSTLHITQPCIMNRAQEGRTISSSAELASSLFERLGDFPFSEQSLLGRWLAPSSYVSSRFVGLALIFSVSIGWVAVSVSEVANT